MQAFGEQQIAKLKYDFAVLDTDHDGFINTAELEKYMKQVKIFNIPIWKVKETMQTLSNKMSQEDFIIWITGCKAGLQDIAGTKFTLFKQIQTIKSAGPPAFDGKIQTTNLDIKINQKNQQTKPDQLHYLNIKVGLDKQQSILKKQELEQVLGRSPSQINCVLKIKTVNDGKLIAQQLSEIAELGLALASELGPTATPITESINLTTKWHKQHVYLVVELNNTFLNLLLKFIKKAIEELAPEGKTYLNAQIQSDFSQVLQPSFKPLDQSLRFYAQRVIGQRLLSKIKEKIVEGGHDKMNQKEKESAWGTFYDFLFGKALVSKDFESLQEFCKYFSLQGINKIPESKEVRQQLKSFQISQIIKQFLPDGDKLLKSIQQSCSPEGSLNVNISQLSVNLSFNFNIKGFFDIL